MKYPVRKYKSHFLLGLLSLILLTLTFGVWVIVLQPNDKVNNLKSAASAKSDVAIAQLEHHSKALFSINQFSKPSRDSLVNQDLIKHHITEGKEAATLLELYYPEHLVEVNKIHHTFSTWSQEVIVHTKLANGKGMTSTHYQNLMSSIQELKKTQPQQPSTTQKSSKYLIITLLLITLTLSITLLLFFYNTFKKSLNNLYSEAREVLNKASEYRYVNSTTNNKSLLKETINALHRYIDKTEKLENKVAETKALVDVEVKQKTDKYRVEVQKAKRLERQKDFILKCIDRNIRTPLNSIIGFSELAYSTNLSEQKHFKYLHNILLNGKRLNGIVDDMIQLSQLNNTLEPIKKTKVSIIDLFDELIADFEFEAAHKELDFRNTIRDSKGNQTIKTDKNKLYRIFVNLIHNALNFTDKGFIEIGYSYQNSYFQFYVRDTGIGMDSLQIENLFHNNLFNDSSNQTSLIPKGMGLTVAKEYVERLNGSIWADSVVGEGTSIYFTLPANPSLSLKKEDSEIQKQKQTASNNLTILIAEDDISNQEFLRETFASQKQLLIAKNGKEAISFVEDFEHIDIVLMDIRMPIMNGTEAIQVIKKMKPNLPIIAQTAYTMSSDREQAIKAGCDDYITKPINAKVLKSLIDSLL